MSETEILGYTRHPASAVWPDLGENEYAALRENIKDQGQDHPILATPDKRVIDGWHRLRACAEIPIDPRVITCHFDERDVARKVIGAHAGRRHMTQIEIARLTIETMKVVGMEHAPPNRPQKADQADPLSEKTITRGAVAKDANVSESTARRAIQEDKRKSGLLPARPAPAKRNKTPTEPDSAADATDATPEAASNGTEAPSSPGGGAETPAPEPPAEQTDAIAGDPDPSLLGTIRNALAQLRYFDPADVVANLDAEQIGEFYDLGQAVVDVGFAMVRAAGPHRAQADAAAAVVPGKPAAEDGLPDIPRFLDRRGGAAQDRDG